MVRVNGKVADKKAVLKDKGYHPYRQAWIVFAKVMDEDFEVETDTGLLVGKRGDYLVWGPRGNKWPADKSMFEANFEKV